MNKFSADKYHVKYANQMTTVVLKGIKTVMLSEEMALYIFCPSKLAKILRYLVKHAFFNTWYQNCNNGEEVIWKLCGKAENVGYQH